MPLARIEIEQTAHADYGDSLLYLFSVSRYSASIE
jgi:hypothetical protein